ncbi:Protein of unassigned function [Burkholderia ambifaria]
MHVGGYCGILLRAPFAWGTNGGFDEARTSVAQAEISFEDRLLQASKAAAPRVKMPDSMDRPKRKSTLCNTVPGTFFRAPGR